MYENRMKKLLVMIVLAAVAGSASAALVTTTTYTGSGALIDVVYDNNSSNGVIGTIVSTNSNSWSSGLPSDSNPGLFDGSVGDGTAGLSTTSGWNVWYGVAVRQTGGTLSDTSFTMLGGAEDGSSVHSTLEIDDALNTAFATTNLAISGKLLMWNQNGAAGATGNTLRLLNGYADVGEMAATASADESINILNGRLDVGYFSNARVLVNMLDGGTGQFNLADMYGDSADPDHKSKLKNLILNFESGSEASFTIASNGGATAQGTWETKIAAGQVKIDGVVVNAGQFQITDLGALGTTITLPPPPPPDFDPPIPNPAGFTSQPIAISRSELWMTATVGRDASGVVEYLFTETSGNPGGASSAWQYSPNFTAVGLSSNTQYSYTVTMRDAFGNTGTVSSAVAATTLATDPPGPELRPSRVCVATSGEHAGKLVRYDAAGNPVLLKAFGVNYHTAFLRSLDDVNDTSFIAGFEYLRDHYIPVARVMAAGFWPNDWNLYFTDQTEYFRRMDYFIAQAEQHGIGLILCLFWSDDTLGELVDDAVVAGYLTPGVDFVPPSPLNRDEFGAETYDEYRRAMGRPDSGSNAFIKYHTREMVERYKNSPAIWGWEFGNEYNLAVDHPNVPNGRVRWGSAAVQGMTLADSNTNLVVLPAWTGPDDLVRADVWVAKTNFAHTVRSIDPWRLITSGAAKSLRSAYHNMTEHTWTVDSRAEHAQVLPVDNPAPMDTVSVHIYPSKPGEENLNPHIYFTDDPVTNSWVDGQYKELLDYFMAESAALGQLLVVGEWGGRGDGTTADEKTTFHRWVQALIDSGVQLSLLWNFDNTHLNQIDYWWVNPGTPKEYQLTNEDPDLWDLEQANLYSMAGYDSWDWNFAQADLSDPTADFDSDGMSNLAEYALGGNPTHNDAAAVLPVFQPLENDFYYLHNERTDDTNLIYTVQLTTNLVSNGSTGSPQVGWNTNGLEFVGAARSSNVWKVVTHKVPTLGKDQQFIRLKIEKD